MQHQSAFELLPLFALDALERRELRRVERHVRSCRRCLDELARYETVAHALSGEMEPSPDTWNRIQERIDAG
jgi:hypothetical protein